MNNILCLIPMRVGSKRLPYKHLYKIGDDRIVDIIYSQLSAAFGSENLVFCLPDNAENDLLANYLNSSQRKVYRGSENDVLARLQKASVDAHHEWIARVNGDNLIILRDLISQAVMLTAREDVDVITNVRPRSFPKGCSIELIRRYKFLEFDSSRLTDSQREHVFPYIYEAIPDERIFNIQHTANFSDLDLSCDDFRQLALLRHLFESAPVFWATTDLGSIRERNQKFEKQFPFIGRSGVFTIAEVGGNHEGDFSYAKDLVSQACATNVDAVKLQVYSPELLVNSVVDKNRYEHFKRFALKRAQYEELFDIIRDSGKLVSASVWSIAEFNVFVDRLDFIKVGSGDLTDALMLDVIRESGKAVILSTGLSSIPEIDWAMNRLKFRDNPSRFGLLQCTSMYPIPDIDCNLAVLKSFEDRFGCAVGYSDHTLGSKALELSVAAGARIQEFHFTDTRDGKVFRDHFVSLTAEEANLLIGCNIKTMTLMGGPLKEPAISEVVAGHIKSFRKGLFLNKNMVAGDTVCIEDLISLRPDSGISASKLDDVVGRILRQDVKYLEPLSFDFFE